MALAGWVRVLSSGSRAVGLLCTLFVVLGMSFACSPVPYNTSSDSPYARPVKPEDLYVEDISDQGLPKIEPGDSLEVVVRRGEVGGLSVATARGNNQDSLGPLDLDVTNPKDIKAQIQETAHKARN